MNALPIPDELLDRLADLVSERLRARMPEPSPWPEWMSVETAARYLDCTPQRLYKLVQREAIPYSQDEPGARVFFNRGDLDAWMRRTRTD